MCLLLQFLHRHAGYRADFFTIEAFFEQRLCDKAGFPRLEILPDALGLSGLQRFCNILNLHYLVGRIRRLRRIRQGLTAYVPFAR